MCAARRAPAPIADRELESLFQIFPDQGRVVLAVSGGADSTVLMVLAARWRGLRLSGLELLAATVDHGLRPQSREEAQQVGAVAARLGLPHAILAGDGLKKRATGIEAAARDLRYRLLVAHALRHGAQHIATAHTLDDQAETVLMRLAAGSGPAGLAGMRARDRRDGVVLLRPFLGVRKARLVATLRHEGVAWSEDPMNRDQAFARPRLRASADALAREGLTPERLAQLARRMARWEEAVAASVDAARDRLRRSGRPEQFDGHALVRAPEEVALRLIAAEIAGADGAARARPYGPRLERLEALWEAVRSAVLAGRPLRRTLGGALVAVGPDGAVTVARAPPRRAGRRPDPAAARPVHLE